MTKIMNIIMIVIDLALITYFFNYAISTTDMVIRLISCAAITMEILFIRRQFKVVKNSKQANR